MFGREKRRGGAGVAVVVALVGCGGFASVADANVYKLSGPIVQRQGTAPGAFDYGYVGPEFVVTNLGTSVDTYVCPTGQSISNWVAVADRPASLGGTIKQWSSGYGNQVNVHVLNWSPPPNEPDGVFHSRLAGSCTTAPSEFPFDPGGCFGDFCPPYPPGLYMQFWEDVSKLGPPGKLQYAQLIQRAFCWSPTDPGCATGARRGVRRFALHNGTNAIDLKFAASTGPRPPAVRLSGAAGCTARRMEGTVENRAGYLRLQLRCRGLKRGAAVRVRFIQPLRLSFHLHRGSASIRVRLSKPPGSVRPLMYLAYGRASKSCNNASARVRLHSRTFDLRLNARCGRAAGNAVAHLYIGGLLR